MKYFLLLSSCTSVLLLSGCGDSEEEINITAGDIACAVGKGVGKALIEMYMDGRLQNIIQGTSNE